MCFFYGKKGPAPPPSASKFGQAKTMNISCSESILLLAVSRRYDGQYGSECQFMTPKRAKKKSKYEVFLLMMTVGFMQNNAFLFLDSDSKIFNHALLASRDFNDEMMN